MSVCFAVLIFFSILWRLLLGFLTNMHTSRFVNSCSCSNRNYQLLENFISCSCSNRNYQLLENFISGIVYKLYSLQIAVYGKGFNRSARDAWELFQLTGVEALVAYDCSGAVLLMGTVVGGLITGTCAGAWTYTKWEDRVIMVGSTAMLMGMVLVGLAMVVVESAVTSIYICYAEDPMLIHRWDAEFFNQLSETLHQRLQHRSARAREVLSNNRFDSHTQESLSV